MRLDLKKLKPGMILKESLYDDHGELLLRSGVRVTPDILKKLGDGESVVAEPLDSRIDSYSANLPGSDVSRYGCTPFNEEQVERLQQAFSQASHSVDELASHGAAGRLDNADALIGLTEKHMQAMAEDLDQVLHATCKIEEDKRLAARSLRLSMLSIGIGMELDLAKEDLIHLGLIGLVHDWSLFGLSPEEQAISGSMSPQQRLDFKRHPHDSHAMLKEVSGVHETVLSACCQVHERIDGSGFPCALGGRAVGLHARIVGLADAYLEMTEPLGTTPAVVPCDAVAYLLAQMSMRRFDPAVLRGFLQTMTQYPIGSLLELTDGRVVRVMRGNGKLYGFPIVQDLRSDELFDLSLSDASVMRPMLRKDPPECRLKSHWRQLSGKTEVLEYVDSSCLETEDEHCEG